jgi:hypothetical protein
VRRPLAVLGSPELRRVLGGDHGLPDRPWPVLRSRSSLKSDYV